MATPFHLRWPLRCLPACTRAGSFPMQVPGCNRQFAHPTVALHLHEYAGDFWVGPRRYRLEAGDLTLSPGGKTTTRYEIEASGHHLCIHFQPQAVKGTTIGLPFHLRLGPVVAEARERIWRVIDHLRQAADRENSPAACAASASLQELLLWLHLQTARATGPSRKGLVDSAMRKLEQAIEHSLTKPMLLEELTAGTGLSTDYLAREFSCRYGMRLQRYLLLRRIELARHLLISSDLPVSEIGRQVGLPDPQYFNKQFRRIAGVSPLAYRRQAGANA